MKGFLTVEALDLKFLFGEWCEDSQSHSLDSMLTVKTRELGSLGFLTCVCKWVLLCSYGSLVNYPF